MMIPKVLALILLAIEVLIAVNLSLTGKTKARSGRALFLDALTWLTLLTWGGFWQ